MSASTNIKKQCVTCNKTGGILICDGCQQIFCSKHVIEHREKLAEQLDDIIQEHDLFQNKIEQISVDHLSLMKIDQWENESIAKIRLTAEIARKNLQKVLDQSKERLIKICRDAAIDLHLSRKADDYSENDFIRWTEQLKTLQSESASLSLFQIIENEKSVIHLIQIESNDSNNNVLINIKEEPSLPINSTNLQIQEYFFNVHGPAIIKNDGYLVTHTGSDYNHACILGNLLYTHGHHTVRFKLEKCHQPYSIFFGCTSAQTALNEGIFTSSSTVGWFGSNQVYQHGRCISNSKKYNYNSGLIMENDVLHIKFDCDNKRIQLFNEPLRRLSALEIDIDKTPYPWRLLIIMMRSGDCVSILNDI